MEGLATEKETQKKKKEKKKLHNERSLYRTV